MAKPTFSLPVIMDARTTKRLLDDEVNRYGGLIWDGTIVAASDPTLAQQVRDDVAQSAADAQQSAADAALYDGPKEETRADFFASGKFFDQNTIVETRAEGFAYRAVDTATATTVANAGGQVFEVLPGADGRYSVKAFGAVGDGNTDDAAAINTIIDGPAVFLPNGTHLVNSPLVSTDNLIRLEGIGWHEIRTSGFSSKVTTGSLIEAPSTVADVLTVQSTSPSSGDTTVASRVTLAGFGIIHKGTGAGININNVTRPHIRDVLVDCDNTGAFGITFDNWAFFSRMERVFVSNFTDTGVLADGAGFADVIKECHISAGATANATAALEMRKFAFEIEGGQINCNNSDNSGIGILLNNTDTNAQKTGGKIKNVACEHDTAVKITGTTQGWESVYIEGCFWNLGNVNKGVIFDRASYCILDRPFVDSPSGAGVLAEFTANAIACGIITTYPGARASLIVDANATDCWKRVISRVPYSLRPQITTYPNFTVTIDDCEFVGQTQHNGVAWDKYWSFISDDDVAVFDIPFGGGVIEIVTRRDAEADGSVSFVKNVNTTRDLRGGIRLARAADGTVLTGTTSGDGDVTISLAGGQLYVENRTGAGDNFLIRYYGRTTA